MAGCASDDRASWQRIPAVRQARTYERAWLGRDLVAGVVLTGLLAPAGMAYAAAAGLPPVNGLYASIIPLFVYAVFGPSRIMVLGPDSSLTPLIAAAVLPAFAVRSVGGRGRRQACWPSSPARICVVAGLARFGFLAELLSAPGALRLPARHRHHHHRQPGREALRLLGPRRVAVPAAAGIRRRAAGRAVQRLGARRRHAVPRDHPRAQGGLEESPGHPHRRRRGHRRVGACSTSSHAACRWWATCPAASPRPRGRRRAGSDMQAAVRRRARRGVRRVRRHQRALAHDGDPPARDASTTTTSWWRWASPTSAPGCSRASPSAPAARARPVAETSGARTQLTGVVAAVAHDRHRDRRPVDLPPHARGHAWRPS